jgi:hypothetical protein
LDVLPACVAMLTLIFPEHGAVYTSRYISAEAVNSSSMSLFSALGGTVVHASRGLAARSRRGPPWCSRGAPAVMRYPGVRPWRMDSARAEGDWLSGRAPRSHRGGHWFDPSIAHPQLHPGCTQVAIWVQCITPASGPLS